MTWDDLKANPPIVYSTEWCPDCHRLKRVFKEHGVPFQEVDIDADPKAAEFLRANTGRTAIPYVRLDGDVFVRGWHDEKPGRFDKDLFLKEVAEATR